MCAKLSRAFWGSGCHCRFSDTLILCGNLLRAIFYREIPFHCADARKEADPHSGLGRRSPRHQPVSMSPVGTEPGSTCERQQWFTTWVSRRLTANSCGFDFFLEWRGHWARGLAQRMSFRLQKPVHAQELNTESPLRDLAALIRSRMPLI